MDTKKKELVGEFKNGGREELNLDRTLALQATMRWEDFHLDDSRMGRRRFGRLAPIECQLSVPRRANLFDP